MIGIGLIVAIIIDGILFGISCILVANRKGNNAAAGFILGFLFGPFGLLFVYFNKTNDILKNNDFHKQCPHCFEYVKLAATICKHCQSNTSDVKFNISSRSNLLLNNFKKSSTGTIDLNGEDVSNKTVNELVDAKFIKWTGEHNTYTITKQGKKYSRND